MKSPEFSRPVRLPAEPRDLVLVADAAECAALAARFGIVAIHAFRADLRLQPQPGGFVRIRGRLHAEVEQDCIVTLEPVRQSVDAPVDLRVLEEGETPRDDPEGPDEIESAGGIVELGEAVAEELALSLDPYPRAEGAALPDPEPEEEPEPARPNPFARLARLRDA